MKIGIIDYKAGNLKSVANAIRFVGRVDPMIVQEPKQLLACDKVILPGVGAFPRAMQNLEAQGFCDALHEAVMVRQKWFLGICLGMQLIMDKSYEHGETEGLKWVRGDVRPMAGRTPYSIPHMGWNDIQIIRPDRLLADIEGGADFYHVHSFFVQCEDRADVLATCHYGFDFDTVLRKDNVFAVQFHPEKSQRHGLKILQNFLEI